MGLPSKSEPQNQKVDFATFYSSSWLIPTKYKHPYEPPTYRERINNSIQK